MPSNNQQQSSLSPALFSPSSPSLSPTSTPPLQSPAPTPTSIPSDIESLQALVAKLQKQLKACGVDPEAASLSLSEIKEKLHDATSKLMKGDETYQHEFDKWERILSSHPEHIEQQEKEDADWESSQRPINLAALQSLRKIFPKQLTNCKKSELVAKCGPALATRITRKPSLRMLTMDTVFIAKMHAADLVCKYAFNGLDLRETRALYAALPPNGFENDVDGRKAEWGYNLREKLKVLTSKETAGSLRDEEIIARDYPDTKAKPKRTRRSSTTSLLESPNSATPSRLQSSSGKKRRGIANMLEGKVGLGKGSKERRGSIASMLEGKLGKKSNSKMKKENGTLAALFAAGSRGNPEDPKEEKLNRKRFAAGKENKVAWRAPSKKRNDGRKKVAQLANAFKQAQSALNQLMSNKNSVAVKAPSKKMTPTTIETKVPDTSSVQKRPALFNELKSLLDDRRRSMAPAKRKLLMLKEVEGDLNRKGDSKVNMKTEEEGTSVELSQSSLATNIAIVTTKTTSISGVKSYGLYLPWYLAVIILLLALIGASILSLGFWINGSTPAIIKEGKSDKNYRRKSMNSDIDSFNERRRRTPKKDTSHVEHAFTFDASQVRSSKPEDTSNVNLFPVTTNRKGCLGNAMNAGCVYTATSNHPSKSSKNVDVNDEKVKGKTAASLTSHESVKIPPVDKRQKKQSKYRAWQLSKRKEEEAEKRKVAEITVESENGEGGGVSQ